MVYFYWLYILLYLKLKKKQEHEKMFLFAVTQLKGSSSSPAAVIILGFESWLQHPFSEDVMLEGFWFLTLFELFTFHDLPCSQSAIYNQLNKKLCFGAIFNCAPSEQQRFP